ncbi:MAG: glycosyl transferase family 1, partial [Thermodesulfovibrionales bacterium]
MKIAIVNNCVPFIYGGAEFLADNLRNRIAEHGHQAMIVKVPFAWDPPSKILDHMLSCRLLRLDNVDRVIALKFPAYYIEHPEKVLWLVHQFRQAYDLWNTSYRCIPDTSEGLRIRDAIIGSDNRLLGGIKKRYTISKLVSERLRRFNNLDSKSLYPPLDDPQKYHCTEYGDYVFYPSRIVGSKRQALAVESMKHVKSGVK